MKREAKVMTTANVPVRDLLHMAPALILDLHVIQGREDMRALKVKVQEIAAEEEDALFQAVLRATVVVQVGHDRAVAAVEDFVLPRMQMVT